MPEKKTVKKGKISEENLNTKLQYIQANLKAPKGQYNKFGNYNYRNCEDILEALKPLLVETKTTLIIRDEVIVVGDRYYIKATAILSNTLAVKPNFEVIKISAFAREPESRKGMDEAQITGATSSYARKYALNGLFAIDDARDPDTQDNTEPMTNKAQNIKQPDNIPKTKTSSKKSLSPQETKALNLVVETLAVDCKEALAGRIIDIPKLKSAVLEKYGQFPTKIESARVVIEYIINELGVEKISVINDFVAGLEKGDM